MQGITTFVGGNCVFSSCFVPKRNKEDVVMYLENLSGQSQKENITWSTPAEFVGHMEERGLLHPNEQEKMNYYLEQALFCIFISHSLL